MMLWLVVKVATDVTFGTPLDPKADHPLQLLAAQETQFLFGYIAITAFRVQTSADGVFLVSIEQNLPP